MVNELMRTCTQCGVDKKLKEFTLRQSKCKACIASNKRKALKDPEKGDKIREKNKESKKRANATEEGAKKNRENVKRWRRNTGKH